MPFNHTLSAILRGSWLIDKAWANSQLPLILMMLQGKEVGLSAIVPPINEATKSTVPLSGNKNSERPFVIDPGTMSKIDLFKYDWNQDRYVPNPNIPVNSVGIIPISGPITKYNGSCGEVGSIQRSSWVQEMIGRDNIGSIIQIIDTPGGESRAAHNYVSAVNKSKKPVLTYVDGMCASLGMWYASASKEVYLSNEMDQMGSIGSYCSILDFSEYMEKEGIKLIEIYAPQSTEKNLDYREALKGNTSLIESELKKMVDSFISFVSKSRGEKAAANADTWNKGKMFFAQDAVKIGLADGIKSFDQVVSKAAWLAKRK